MQTKTNIKAEIVADSTDSRGNRLISVLATFPRIILAEVNTHRMLSKNTSSSRAIPFKKMVEAVENNPFIPIAWQKEHKGMQGSKYITDENDIWLAKTNWLRARDYAIDYAKHNNEEVGVTKQLCNRLLEPFMWTTMLITGSKEGWDNFHSLRCPQYQFDDRFFKSIKDVCNYIGNCVFVKMDGNTAILTSNDTTYQAINQGQAEIHIMDLAEKIYDAMNESTPKQLKAGEWHIPFEEQILKDKEGLKQLVLNDWLQDKNKVLAHAARMENVRMEDVYGLGKIVKISTAMAARTSYTVVGDEKEVDYQKMIELHDRLIAQNPPHSSPMEHCARAMSDEEYYSYVKGTVDSKIDFDGFINIEGHTNLNVFGWCRNFKGFIQYRHILEI